MTQQEDSASCPDCHALVADLEAHERWHTRLVADVAKSVNQAIDRHAAASS